MEPGGHDEVRAVERDANRESPERLIRHAIADLMPLAGRYHGFERWFCPHALGRKHDEAHLFVYQFDGGSRSGLPPGGDWRCLRLDDLEEVRPAPGPWRTRGNLYAPQSCLDEIDLVARPLPVYRREEGGRGMPGPG